jgi:hypothetical protein
LQNTEFFGFIAIKNELMISEAEIKEFIQLTNKKIDLISSDTKNDTMKGTTDNAMKGKLIKNQNLGLDRIAFVCNQKNIPVNVKLMSPFLLITIM